MSQQDTAPASSSDSPPGTRALTGAAWTAFMIIAIVTAGAHLYANIAGTFSELRVSAFHFGLFGLLCALSYPLVHLRSDTGARLVFWVDVVLGLLALACAVYFFFYEDALYKRGQTFTGTDWVFAVLAIVLVLEFTRRTSGPLVPVLALIGLSYVGLWGAWIDGVFHFPGFSAENLLFRSYFSGEGMFGPIAQISWSFVFVFILFGAFLVRSGAGDFIINMAQLAAGRIIGGPGLVAVISSGLTGSVTGSAIANTVSTGVITIPLMKRSGFPPRFAAGTEAAASTGGQLMPPVMGAGAFIMATYTQVSYLDIIAVALVPALLYFLSVAFFVRIEARRSGLTAHPDPDLRLWPVLQRGWQFLIPITVLIGLLVYGFTPTYAGGYAILAVIAASWLSPAPMGPRAVVEAMIMGTRNMIPTAMLLIAIGLVVLAVTTTGVGATFSLMINSWAGGSLLITFVLIAVASLVLGMGLPVTAAYIVLATLSAEALFHPIADAQVIQALSSGQVTDNVRALLEFAVPEKAALLGQPMPVADARALLDAIPAELRGQMREELVSPEALVAALLSAHMIIFWLSQDSNVTPPVCLTAFAAASIAGTKPMATGLMAWRIAKGLYIIPLLFAYTPLIGGSPLEVITIGVFAAAGLYAFTAAMEGHMEGTLGPVLRLAAAGLSLTLLWPHGVLWADLLAALAVVACIVFTRRQAFEKNLGTPLLNPD